MNLQSDFTAANDRNEPEYIFYKKLNKTTCGKQKWQVIVKKIRGARKIYMEAYNMANAENIVRTKNYYIKKWSKITLFDGSSPMKEFENEFSLLPDAII